MPGRWWQDGPRGTISPETVDNGGSMEPARTREDILQRLRILAPELAAPGVRSLAVFGSFARGEAGPESDVDILVEFEGPATLERFVALRFLLGERLGRRIDLATPRALGPRLSGHVEREALRVA